MNEVIKSIDWTQVGPFVAALLVCAIVLLGMAPFLFKWIFKREDANSEARKRAEEREMLKDKMLLESLGVLGSNLAKSSEIIEGVGTRVCDHVTRTGKEVMAEINKLRDEIDDRKQEQIKAELMAIKEHQISGAPSTRRTTAR